MYALKKHLHLIFSLLVLAAALSACFTGAPRIYEPSDENAVYTAAAQTVVARATLSAGETAVMQLTQMAQGGVPTATPVTSSTAAALPPTATLPAPPTATFFVPTATQVFIPPTRTLPPPPPPQPPVWTPVPLTCDWAQFIEDVSIPDGSRIAPGTAFTKVWLLRNIGSCTWNTAYGLVFVDGERMQAKKYIPLYRNVRPGETVELGVDFVAPTTPGRFRSYWMLINQNGREFGIGSNARTAFWVDIRVQSDGGGTQGYDFSANMCNAVWRSSAGVLPCPGNIESQAGSVVRLSDPVVETGRHENEPALWTRPDSSGDGIITGTFPVYNVRSGDRFIADIGCIYRNRRCDVTFALDYQIGRQGVRTLASWHEVYDEMMGRANVDLSALAGQSVTFILRVENNGRWSDANALWFVPAIRNSAPPPTSQPMPTPQPMPTSRPPNVPPSGELPAVAAARYKLAYDLGVNPARLELISYEPVYWPDTCLGLPQRGQMCAQVVVYGYRIIWSLNGQFYETRTDESGATVYWVQLAHL